MTTPTLHHEDAALYNLQAEEATLAGLVMDPGWLGQISTLLAPADFYATAHQIIYRALLARYGRGEPIDPITLSGDLAHAALPDGLEPFAYLMRLVADVLPTASGTPHYAQIVKRLATNRAIVELGQHIQIVGYDDTLEVDELVARVHSAVGRLTQGAQHSAFVPLARLMTDYIDVIDARMATPGQGQGVPSGFPDLDKLTGGFQATDLVILATRPAGGKTAMAVNIMRAAAHAGKTVALFSIEMSAEQIAGRFICQEGSLDSNRLRLGYVNIDPARERSFAETEYERLLRAAGTLADYPIYVNDTSTIATAQMSALLRALHEQTTIDLVVVDYLQIVQGARQTDTRVREVDKICRDLKSIARDLSCCVLALAQVSRELDGGAEPELKDLRESGGIEQEADAVLFIHRYDKEDDRKVRLLLKKQRNGPQGDVSLWWLDTYARFESVATRPVGGYSPPTADAPDDDDDSPI